MIMSQGARLGSVSADDPAAATALAQSCPQSRLVHFAAVQHADVGTEVRIIPIHRNSAAVSSE